jgi:hypothetical protein
MYPYESEVEGRERGKKELQRLNSIGWMFVPPGMDQSKLNLKGRTMMNSGMKGLNEARFAGDIFAYNSALSTLRGSIARAKGGWKLPLEMPDEELLRKRAVMRQQRMPVGSREMNTSFGMGML